MDYQYEKILELYQKYPDDIVIQFELAKDSVIFSKPDKYQEILKEMEKNRDNQQDENKIKIYDNYIMYAKAMNELAQCKYDKTKTIILRIYVNEYDSNKKIKSLEIFYYSLYVLSYPTYNFSLVLFSLKYF